MSLCLGACTVDDCFVSTPPAPAPHSPPAVPTPPGSPPAVPTPPKTEAPTTTRVRRGKKDKKRAAKRSAADAKDGVNGATTATEATTTTTPSTPPPKQKPKKFRAGQGGQSQSQSTPRRITRSNKDQTPTPKRKEDLVKLMSFDKEALRDRRLNKASSKRMAKKDALLEKRRKLKPPPPIDTQIDGPPDINRATGDAAFDVTNAEIPHVDSSDAEHRGGEATTSNGRNEDDKFVDNLVGDLGELFQDSLTGMENL